MPFRIAALIALASAAILLVVSVDAGVVRADVDATVALFGALAFGLASLSLANLAGRPISGGAK
jgi:hypothetical protein